MDHNLPLGATNILIGQNNAVCSSTSTRLVQTVVGRHDDIKSSVKNRRVYPSRRLVRRCLRYRVRRHGEQRGAACGHQLVRAQQTKGGVEFVALREVKLQVEEINEVTYYSGMLEFLDHGIKVRRWRQTLSVVGRP
ncbi:hypothetical protein PR001_g27121 [Phytophthora rubi]|uniref:Uncharacterized protein n=1 Tax=Phytophthora rubi TaxID=129364 RepID=A0A6A3HQL0_9STRA|nr:hypothetical protein PR001_g27121 [Phytophthora rubi]